MGERSTYIIGGVGHRNIPPEQLSYMEEMLEYYIRVCAKKADGLQNLCIMTGLAPGADTLISQKAKSMGIRLHALLPMEIEEYQKDFTNPADKQIFHSSLAFCNKVEVLKGAFKRPVCYQKLGDELVSRSNALLSIWDGKPARGIGGTAEVIEKAKEKNLELFLIKT